MSAMNRLQMAAIAAAGSLLLSGNVLAAMPSAGMQPLFNNTVPVTSTVQRADVHAAAIQNAPIAGQFSDTGAQPAASALTRAQVRSRTLDAIAHGFHVASGERA